MPINPTRSAASDSLNFALERARREREAIQRRRKQIAPIEGALQLTGAVAPAVGAGAGALLGIPAGNPLLGAGVGGAVGGGVSAGAEVLRALLNQGDRERLNRQAAMGNDMTSIINAMG